MEMLRRPMLPEPQARFELDTAGMTTLIVDTFRALFQTRNRILEIRGTAPTDPAAEDRKSVAEGKSVSVRVDLGGRRIIQQKQTHNILKTKNITTHPHSNR